MDIYLVIKTKHLSTILYDIPDEQGGTIPLTPSRSQQRNDTEIARSMFVAEKMKVDILSPHFPESPPTQDYNIACIITPSL